MMFRNLQRSMLFTAMAGMFVLHAAGQNNKPVQDFLSVPGPVIFNSSGYFLSWSAHPSPDFFKQEYIIKGDDPDSYKSMLMLDAVTGDKDLKDVVAAKVTELKKMKETNPIIQYEVIKNPATGEYLLDFILSANKPDGSISVIERNVYRYSSTTNKGGLKITLLFGISTRANGKDATPFLSALKANRKELISKVSQFKIPDLNISN